MNKEAIEEAIAVLNRIHEADPMVLPALISLRVPCNEAVANDPAVQVGVHEDEFEVGVLGIINGIFGTNDDGWGWICAKLDDHKNIVGFDWTPPAGETAFEWVVGGPNG